MTKPRRGISSIVPAVVVVLGLAPATAHAYVDPGTGSYVFQVLLAAFLGSLFAVKGILRRLRAYFAGRGNDSASRGR